MDQPDQSSMDAYDPPVLQILNNYGHSGLQKGIIGTEIQQLLNGRYSNFLELFPNSEDAAIIDPSSDRLDLTHSVLKSFLQNDLDLLKYGITYQSRIAVLVPNGPELAITLVSLVTKWCAAPINPNITAAEVKIELESMKCSAIILLSGFPNNPVIVEVASELGLPVLALHPSVAVSGLFSLELVPTSTPISRSNSGPQTQVTDSGYNTKEMTVLLLHTSGTGGKKKLVPYSLEMLVVGVCCIISSWNLSPDDRCLNMMPLFHIGGIVRNIFSPLLSGGSVICCNAFDPVLFWDILIARRFTWYYAAPTMHHAILLEASQRVTASQSSNQFNLKHIIKPVRFIANAAGGLLPALAESLKRVFQTTILTSYGMTECMPISSPPQDYDLHPVGTSGTLVGPSVLIVGDDMQTMLPPRQAGHIMIKGLPCFKGYELPDSSLDRSSFYVINGEPDWFCTGDCGYLDQEGFLFISGRSKEIINRGGETISPFEIEEAVLSHPSVQEVMCFSSPHNYFQETVGAVLVLKKDAVRPDLPHLHKFLEKSLHRSKWPQILIFMNQLPKNSAGKLLRVRFSDRTKLPSIDDDMSPLLRLYEGVCPPVGTALSTPIEVKLVDSSLEIVETFIRSLPTVETAVAVQLDLPFRRGAVVVFVTPATVVTETLQTECNSSLHNYLCPVLIHATDIDTLHDLPGLNGDSSRTNGDTPRGKEALVARALDLLTSNSTVAPQTDIEIALERIWRDQLQFTRPISITTSFFELGGDSLKAGALVSAVRKRFSVSITVADLFTSPTISSLAQHLVYLLEMEADSPLDDVKAPETFHDTTKSSRISPDQDLESGLGSIENWEYSMKLSSTSWGCLMTQLIPLFLLFPLRRLSMWFLIAGPWVVLMNAGVDRFPALILAMGLMRIISGTIFPLLAVLCKWLIIGKYKAGRYPLWGVMYLKWWLVEQIFRIAGKGIYRDDFPVIGTFLVRLYYTLCGASIGKNVKISRNAMLGQVDLLAIGDDVIIDNATVLPFSLEEGHFVLLPIVIGDRCSIGAKATVAAGSVLLSGTHIGPLSSSHEKDDATPNNLSFCRPAFPSPPWYLVLFYGVPVLVSVAMVSYAPWVIGLHLMVSSAKSSGWYDSEITTMYEAFQWWITPERMGYYFALRVIQRCVVPYVRLLVVILLKWSIIGAFRPLSSLERHRPFNLFRYWLMARLLPGGDLGGVAPLVGTHYAVISMIYRALGAKVGKRVYWPGSGLDIVEYDLLEVGDDVVFGSRSIIMTSTSEHSNRVVLENGAMLADRCILLPGSILKQGCVFGSGSLAPVDFVGPPGSMWVGSIAGCATMVSPEDPSYQTKDLISPFGRAFYGHDANYCVVPLCLIILYNTVWHGFCVCYHYCPILLSLFIAHYFTEFDSASLQKPVILFRISIVAFVPVFITLSLFALLLDIIFKWMIIGRRQQGDYSWDKSSYCQRWQLHLTLQQIRRGEREHTGLLELICGSQYLVWYFRALGCKIGDNVCLYPNGGDPMMTEPDMVTIGSNTCVDNASLIAHINTRGVFKLNPIVVGENCVLKSNTRLLSGSAMEDHSILMEHTLVISGETVDYGSVWQGWPSQLHYPIREHRDGLTNLLSSKDLDLMTIFLSTNSASSMASMIRRKKRQHAAEQVSRQHHQKNTTSSTSTQTFFDRFVNSEYQALKTDESLGASSHHS